VDALPQDSRIIAHRFEVEGDSAGEMYGTAYLTKANIAVEGQPLDCCSAILAGYRSPYEATVTRRLREAGVTCLGSTNMDEFAMGSSGETSVLGGPEHPWLRGRVCGGSSAGSAAAVARGVVPFALGSDTGGSVRQPAACCGLVGLKPTWGRVSRYGLVAHASSLDTIGVLARYVRDAERVLRVIEGVDRLDSTLRDWPRPTTGLRRVAILDLPENGVSDPVQRDLARLVDQMIEAGLEVRRIRLASLDAALGAYVVLAASEAASNLARYDGSLYGARVEAESYEHAVRSTRDRGFGPEVKLRVLLGTEVLRQGHSANALGRARAVVRRLSEEFEAALAPDDVCLLPTMPDVAFGLGTRLDDPLAMRATDRFTVLASLLGLPAVAVPSGEDEDGAPTSVQCVARRGRDDLALALGAFVERSVGVDSLRERSWVPRMESRGA
jgi:aspartyl-tRNA(Asn)/glutamyl-tRNA(Gln) amidotransferase subunit A